MGERRAVVIPIALVLIPLLYAGGCLLGHHWFPSSDWSVEVLRIRQVGSRATPLVGVPSRFGWDHPGPAMFYALAPFDRLFGTTGILIGTVLVNLAAVVLALVFVRRREPALVWLLAAALLVLFRSQQHLDLLTDPWNPWLAVLPFLAFVVVAWSVAERDWVALPWMVGLGSFVVQTHVGYALLVAVGWLFAALVAVVGHGRPRESWQRVRSDLHESARPARMVGFALAVAASMWLLPVLQQLFGRTGNLSEIASYFTSSHHDAIGLQGGWKVMSAEMRWWGPWVTGRDWGQVGLVEYGTPGQALSRVAVMVAAAVVASRMRRDWRPFRLAALVLTSLAVGVWALGHIDGAVGTYLVRWTWTLAAMTTVSTAWSVLVIAGALLERSRPASWPPRPAVRRAAAGMASLGLLALVVVGVATSRVSVPQPAGSDAVGSLARQALPRIPSHRTYIVRPIDQWSLGAVGTGLFIELLDRRGGVRLDQDSGRVFGAALTANPHDVDGVIWVVDHEMEPPADVAHGSRIAVYDPLTPAERERVDVLADEVHADLARDPSVPFAPSVQTLRVGRFFESDLVHDGISPAKAEELHDLANRGLAYDVYLTTVAPTPPPGGAARPAGP